MVSKRIRYERKRMLVFSAIGYNRNQKLVTDHYPTSSVGYDKGETDLGFQSD